MSLTQLCSWLVEKLIFGVVSVRRTDNDHQSERKQEASSPKVGSPKAASPKSPISTNRPQLWAILDGMRLILASPYLLLVSLFLWLGAVISSFFYFQVRQIFIF